MADADVLRAELATTGAAGFVDPQPATGTRFDWQALVRFFAAQVVVGYGDGYIDDLSNYYLHFDDTGLAQLMPWGSNAQLPPQVHATRVLGFSDVAVDGELFRACINDDACLAAYQIAIEELAAFLPAMATTFEARAVRLRPSVEFYDPRFEFGYGLAAFDQAAIAWPAGLRGLHDQLLCGRADSDGDGLRCAFDCDESNPNIHLMGAAPDDDCDPSTQ